MRGKRMAKGMGADLLRQPGPAHGDLDGLVDDAGVHMMATGDTRTRVDGEMPSREDILPAPFCCGLPIFPGQRLGQVDGSMALRQVLLMQGFDSGEVVLEERGQRGRK